MMTKRNYDKKVEIIKKKKSFFFFKLDKNILNQNNDTY